MHHPLTIKAGVMSVLVVLLLIPLSLIQGVVAERKGLRDGVVRGIAQHATGEQKLIGPILVIPYRQVLGGPAPTASLMQPPRQPRVKARVKEGHLFLPPTSLQITNAVVTQERYRGIYKALLYSSTISLKGKFSVPEGLGLTGHSDHLELKPAYVVLGIHDVRGIKANPSLLWQTDRKVFQPGTNGAILKKGIHAPVGTLDAGGPQSYEFSVDLTLQGMERLEFAPVGKETTVTLQADWPHPSFIGRYLPEHRRVTDQGFEATWRTTFFSTNMDQLFRTCTLKACAGLKENTLGVSFIRPVDIYLQTERAVKYGVLFVGLTFGAFFLFEIFKRLPIHPIQYAFVGLALVIFYLLLISLSEHVTFAAAYFMAGAGCVGLLGFYVSYLLKSVLRSVVFAAMHSSLYGVLYVLLQLEDYALMMGSLFLFTVLALVMGITRKVDWYELGDQFSAADAK